MAFDESIQYLRKINSIYILSLIYGNPDMVLIIVVAIEMVERILGIHALP